MNLLTKHDINQCCKGMSHSVNRYTLEGPGLFRLSFGSDMD